MNIRLEAFSPTDGTGIVRVTNLLRLLRPPYRQQDCPVLPEKALQEAITRFGYSEGKAEFSSWAEAIAFLNEQTRASRSALGKEVPNEIDGARVIAVASADTLSALLDRVENVLIPGRMLEHAEKFLITFLASDALTKYPAQASRAAKLLQHTNKICEQTEADQSELASRDLRFTSLEKKEDELKKSNHLARVIERRGSFFVAA
jgi:hypothetical protein